MKNCHCRAGFAFLACVDCCRLIRKTFRLEREREGGDEDLFENEIVVVSDRSFPIHPAKSNLNLSSDHSHKLQINNSHKIFDPRGEILWL